MLICARGAVAAAAMPGPNCTLCGGLLVFVAALGKRLTRLRHVRLVNRCGGCGALVRTDREDRP